MADRVGAGAERTVHIDASGDAGGERLPAIVSVPEGARALVIFAHGAGSSRLSPRNAKVAQTLREAGLATLLLDLLTEDEAANRDNVFDIGLLAARLQLAAAWARAQPELRDLPAGIFGASTGAAAALVAAADDPDLCAVVCRGGRPDLAGEALSRVGAPVLLVVGARDEQVLELNRKAQRQLAGPSRLEVIPGATHLFEEAGAMEQVAKLAAGWFRERLTQDSPAPARQRARGGRSDRAQRRPAPTPGSLPNPVLGFRDRDEAGEVLARALEPFRQADPVVLGLPRGGVEVGSVIALRLEAPLDVLLVRKLPAPPQPELAIGAVANGAEVVRVLNEQRIAAIGLSEQQVEEIVSEQLAEVRRREALYRGARPAVDVRGRTAIVVDDGVATGATAEAALRAVRARKPAELIFAASVGAPEAVSALSRHCDRVICPLQPEGFCAVGAYYGKFDQLDDARVIELLRRAG